MRNPLHENPFSVTRNPESLPPDIIASLFVDTFTDIPQIRREENTFIHGQRGTGKSMMLRWLEPEVQFIEKKISFFNELDFFAIHFPLKSTRFPTELKSLTGDRFNIFAEHFFILHICMKLFNKLESYIQKPSTSNNASKEYTVFINDFFVPLLKLNGVSDLCHVENFSFYNVSVKLLYTSLNFVKNTIFSNTHSNYTGPLFDYLYFLVPICENLRQLKFMPNAPLFLMLDDADILGIDMQKIFNTWVSYRTCSSISLKITTQFRYMTKSTVSGVEIEHPHDYSEVDLTTIYSPNKTYFSSKVQTIISKRFSLCGIESTPLDFFPKNKNQEQSLERIRNDLRTQWETGLGRGHRMSDDLTRYAVPIYMRELHSSKKASSKFSYAGFYSLTCLSDGVIRWFLELAAEMYSKCKSISPELPIKNIPVNIQDDVIKNWSESFITNEFDKSLKDYRNDAVKNCQFCNDDFSSLRNLINGLGMLFRKRLLDEKSSEPRIFSVLVRGAINQRLETVINLGTELGYFRISSIGKKEGIGKTLLLILARRLAPFFTLDVSSFAGNISVPTKLLEIALDNPDNFVQQRSHEKSAKDYPLLSMLEEDCE
ncbi:hypothetical protein K9F62_11145 [Desulfovibrio sp. JY]|nr:hypothetical protein K9F62_11145 [Desulfovibrio sp. JY]